MQPSQEKPVWIPKPWSVFSLRAISHRRSKRQKVFAESAYFLHGGIVIALRIEKQLVIGGDHMSRSATSSKMTVGRARLTRQIVWATRLHLAVTPSRFPTVSHERPSS